MLENKIKAAVEDFKGRKGVSALAVDWTALIGIIAEVLLPLLMNCFNKGEAVRRMKSMGFRDTIALRLALRKRVTEDRNCQVCFGVRRHVSELVESLQKTAAASSEDELAEIHEEAIV